MSEIKAAVLHNFFKLLMPLVLLVFFTGNYSSAQSEGASPIANGELDNIGVKQMVKVEGAFDRPEMLIGEEVHFSLVATYSRNANIVFPDSTFKFAPFEYVSKKYFPTVTNFQQDISKDCVVYTLTTFELEPSLTFSMPVYELTSDTIKYYTENQGIEIKQSTPDEKNLMNLKTNVDYAAVKYDFNYIIAAFVSGGTLLILLLSLIFFGKKIKLFCSIRKLKIKHRQFPAKYFELLKNVAKSADEPNLINVLFYWKGYMEDLERQPISKLSTKEIFSMYGSKPLQFHLSSIDRCIYAGIRHQNLLKDYEFLMSFSTKQLEKKINTMKEARS